MSRTGCTGHAFSRRDPRGTELPAHMRSLVVTLISSLWLHEGCQGLDLVLGVARRVHEWGTAVLALKQPGLVAGVHDRAAGTKRSLRD